MRRSGLIRQLRITTLAWIGLALAFPATAWTQDPDADTQFEMSSSEDAPCPPRFASIYDSRTGMRFFGTSRFTMQQYDHAHDAYLYTYEFIGLTPDETHRVKGTHHVSASQCIHAAYSYYTGIPARIALLHNETIYILRPRAGCSGVGAEEYAEHTEVSSPQPPPTTSPCGGSGGSAGGEPLSENEWYEWLDGVRFRCHREYDNGWSSVICIADS